MKSSMFKDSPHKTDTPPKDDIARGVSQILMFTPQKNGLNSCQSFCPGSREESSKLMFSEAVGTERVGYPVRICSTGGSMKTFCMEVKT